MIHYHGSPIGGRQTNAVEFFRGRHAFVSFAHPGQLETIASVCQSFALDNGAFSHWKRGGKLDVNAYYEWCNRWYRHPGCDWVVIPDVIDGDEKQNDDMLRAWPLTKDVSVPVWHYHESIDRLAWLVSVYPRVALGSSGDWPTPGTRDWWNRTTRAMQSACDANGVPRAKLHGLRMLNPAIFRRMPLSSADSTNAVRNSRENDVRWSGPYRPRDVATRAKIIADAVEQHQSATVYRTRSYQVSLFAAVAETRGK